MRLNGVAVESVCIHQALVQVLEYIQKKSRPVLVGHNILSYDVPVLRNVLKEFNRLSSFNQAIYGCIDTLRVSRREFLKSEVENHKQRRLVRKFQGISYAAHNSAE